MEGHFLFFFVLRAFVNMKDEARSISRTSSSFKELGNLKFSLESPKGESLGKPPCALG